MAVHPNVIPMSDRSDKITAADVAPTNLPDAYLDSEFARAVQSFALPRFRDIPDIGLYREQLIDYLDSLFKPLGACSDGPWITSSMVNNYVKSRLVPAPVNKRYSREAIARLIVICVFKQTLSIAQIGKLFGIQRMTYRTETAYDYTVRELEHALATALSYGSKPTDDTATLVTRESLLVRCAVGAFAAKVNLVGYLNYLGYDE